jgi:uncharacterized membrane protein YhaH (DUF805 family)/uncharacterized RDD family membrane protein YckC
MAYSGHDDDAGLDVDASSERSFATWQTWSRPAATPAPPSPTLTPLAAAIESPEVSEWGTMAAIPRLRDWPDGEWRFASFGQRLGAILIDVVVFVTVGAVLETAAHTLGWSDSGEFAGELFAIAYICGANAYGKSIGKAVLGIEVVNRDWKRPGLIGGIVRWFISNVSGLFLLLGYLNVFWDRERRAWHDHAAGTWVVCRRRWPDTSGGVPSEPRVVPMPFCRHCGYRLEQVDFFCARCGRQRNAPSVSRPESRPEITAPALRASNVASVEQRDPWWTRILSFQGRVNRRTFALSYVLLQVATLALFVFLAFMLEVIRAVVDPNASEEELYSITIALWWISVLIFLAPNVCLAVRRFHDLGMKGTSAFLLCVPFVVVPFVFALLLKSGDLEANEYGVQPRPEFSF